MKRKPPGTSESLQMAFWLAVVILLIAYALSGLIVTPGWHQ